MNIRRAVLAAAVQIAATILVTVVIVSVYVSILAARDSVSLPESELEAIGERVGQWTALIVGVVTAFAAGWWGARGLGDNAVKQGFAIGALIAVFGLVIDVTGGDIGAMTAASVLLNFGAAVAGAWLARSRQPAVAP